MATPDLLKDSVTLVSTVVGLLGAVMGFVKYFNYRSRKDLMETVGTRFTAVVDALGSNDEVKRRAAAIMLRRFFDPSTEFGVADTPYAKEAVDVIAAILREERSSSFQKLLADGLPFAPDLVGADLQKTNLQNAYLVAPKKRRTKQPSRTFGLFGAPASTSAGSQGPDQGKTGASERVNLSKADFYRADLSDASLKDAIAVGATFYQARLAHTVFKGADLTDANFFEADLQGARFKDALLDGAKFGGARNVPEEIATHLDAEGNWVATLSPAQAALRAQAVRPLSIFLSRPAAMRAQGLAMVEQLKLHLSKLGPIKFVELSRHDYPAFGALAEVRKRVAGCSGVVALGLGELDIVEATWRAGTPDECQVKGEQWPSPWTQIEAGMGVGLDLPVLLVAAPELKSGIFSSDADGHSIFRVSGVAELAQNTARRTLDDWYATACERARA